MSKSNLIDDCNSKTISIDPILVDDCNSETNSIDPYLILYEGCDVEYEQTAPDRREKYSVIVLDKDGLPNSMITKNTPLSWYDLIGCSGFNGRQQEELFFCMGEYSIVDPNIDVINKYLYT